MKLKTKILTTLSALTLVVVGILAYLAVSDQFYFATLSMDPGEVERDDSGQSQTLPIYLYKDAWNNYKAQVADININITSRVDGLSRVNFEVAPTNHYELDYLNLNFIMADAGSVIILKNPDTGQSLPYEYERHDSTGSMVIEFDSLEAGYGNPISIDFWLDTANLVSSTGQWHMMTKLLVHQDSTLKIVNQNLDPYIFYFELV